MKTASDPFPAVILWVPYSSFYLFTRFNFYDPCVSLIRYLHTYKCCNSIVKSLLFTVCDYMSALCMMMLSNVYFVLPSKHLYWHKKIIISLVCPLYKKQNNSDVSCCFIDMYPHSLIHINVVYNIYLADIHENKFSINIYQTEGVPDFLLLFNYF